MTALAGHNRLELYPINPKQLARDREAVFPSGSKNDPNDAALIAEFLQKHHPKLHVWQPDESLTRQIRELNQASVGFEQELEKLTPQHEDHELFRSLPGAGDALVPRLIAAFGTDRDRFDDAEQVQCYSGIAPITRQSGNTRHVNQRIACSKFLRQAFHEFADQARRWSRWSKAFYRMKNRPG